MKDAYFRELDRLLDISAERNIKSADYEAIASLLKVSSISYDMYLGEHDRYRNPYTKKLVMADREEDGEIILFDSGKKTGQRKTFTYYYEGIEYVHAHLDFEEGADLSGIDDELLKMMANFIYIIVSRQNMRQMLDFAEITDPQTGIPNQAFLRHKYERVTQTIPPEDILVLYVNLQNFKFINECAGSRSGDAAIKQYSHSIMEIISENEGLCRLGGENFLVFILKENFEKAVKILNSVTISDLKGSPNQVFDISAWIGVSELKPGEKKSFGMRLNDASVSCSLGKTRFKQDITYYTDELKQMISRGHEILSIFPSALENHELVPFFQAKVNMQEGSLIGFEALCRWIHDGKFIFPDQFIPVLDREGLIHNLDMEIFRRTCECIKKWKSMGLNPPRVSSNFSRKNLFVPHIEEKIVSVIRQTGLDFGDIEIEITETVRESEYLRLIEFVRILKSYGIHISVDDFGTGYSSLSLIHNIDADVIKIDKCFVDEVLTNEKSSILIESTLGIAQRLHMSVIAEGVETEEQGAKLLSLGCVNAQGYFYSKPVDFENATELIRENHFVIVQNPSVS